MRKISGALQHYDWGHHEAIAAIRGVEPSGRPEAEYWLGAHPRNPSMVLGGAEDDGTTLDAVIAADLEAWLGSSLVERFGQLPFLLKILAADQPLSIQAHPNLDQARAGFEAEEAAGLDRAAPNRNYRDPNHKPELICALTSFEAKCGFRPLDASRRLFAGFTDPRTAPLRERLGVGDDRAGGHDGEEEAVLSAVMSWLLTLESAEAADLVDGLIVDCELLLTETTRDGSGFEEFEADLRWTARINEAFPGDVGVAVALLLNHLTLEPGQALFLQAGVLHAYLSGVGVELMANSDNVLRGGLTPKHIDVDELLSVATFGSYLPRVQSANGSPHHFDIPVPEFGLVRYRAAGDELVHTCPVEGPEILLVTSGAARVTDDRESLWLSPGEAVVIAASDRCYELELVGGDTVVWRAVVPR